MVVRPEVSMTTRPCRGVQEQIEFGGVELTNVIGNSMPARVTLARRVRGRPEGIIRAQKVFARLQVLEEHSFTIFDKTNANHHVETSVQVPPANSATSAALS